MRCAAPVGLVVWALVAVAAVATESEYEVLQERADRLLVVLPNRLLVVAQELHAAPVVTAQVHVKTGSIYEQDLVGAGLSHFLEHLVSGGTTEVRAEAESNAMLARMGAMTNASTGLDKVRYYIHTTSEHTNTAIDLLSDWLGHCAITQAEFERERDVIQREFEMGAGEPDRIFWKLTQQARFRWHPARHPTIGYLDEFLKIDRDAIHAFYRQMYVPNNMVFLVVGDIDRHAVVERIASLWSDQPARPLPALTFPIEPRVDQPRRLTGTANVERPRLRLAWPGTRLGGDGDYALDLLAGVLGQGESSRLVRTVRDEQRVVNQISAYNLSFAWGEGFFGVDANVAVDRGAEQGSSEADLRGAVAAAEAAILAQVRHLGAEGVTEAELARVKRRVLADSVYGTQSVQALAGRLSHGLIDMGDPDYLARYVHRIQALTRVELQEAARRFLREDRLIAITLLPAPGGAAPAPLHRPDDVTVNADATHAVVELDNAAVVRRLGRLAGGAEDEADAIVADPVHRHVLANGLRVLIGRSTLAPAVAVHLYQPGGLLADGPGREGLTRCAEVMRIKGTEDRSAEAIARQVEDLGAELGTGGAYNTSYTRAMCLREDLPTVLDLFADVVLRPTFPADQWDRMQPRLLAAIDRQTDAWHGELELHFRRAYYGSHPWSTTPIGRRAFVAGLSASDLRAAYRSRLAAGSSVLAIFGDVDPAAVLRQAEDLFGAMPAGPAQPFAPPMPAAPVSTVLQQQTAKPVAAVQIGFGPGLTRGSADYPSMAVLTRVLSKFPSGWLNQQLRGDAGLAYVVWCYQTSGLVPGFMTIVFNADPAKLPEALRRTGAVVERARSQRVDEQSLAAAKAAVLTSEFWGRQSNGSRAASYALDELYGLGLDEPERFRAAVARLDGDGLRAAADRYLRNPVTIVLGREAIAESALAESAALLGAAATP